ncbi:MAG: pilus assembly protein TadG-related protein [Acidimicrobiia bacterium]
MRSLTLRPRIADDDGVVLVWVAIMIVVLLGFGALVLDLGALYHERRQLQNGADAGALAVAQDCAEGDCLDESATADSFADKNASDGQSNIDTVCGSGPGLSACAAPPALPAGVSGWVSVTTSTNNPGNGGNSSQVDYLLAQILTGSSGKTVHATAVAAWGALGKATTIPLIFSQCELAEMGGSINPPSPPAEGTQHYIYFHGSVSVGNCPSGPSGFDDPISGGFGWLATSGCQATITAGGWVSDKPGNGVPNGCNPADWQNKELLIPIYDVTNGLTGSNGSYHVVGFAGFRIIGYRFSGATWPNGFQCPDEPGNSGRCIRGEFTRVTALDGEIGGGADLGARVITMVG